MTRGPFKLTIRVAGAVLSIPTDLVEHHPSNDQAVRRAVDVGKNGFWQYTLVASQDHPGRATYYPPASILRCHIHPPLPKRPAPKRRR